LQRDGIQGINGFAVTYKRDQFCNGSQEIISIIFNI
jgi:hypothetical protein